MRTCCLMEPPPLLTSERVTRHQPLSRRHLLLGGPLRPLRAAWPGCSLALHSGWFTAGSHHRLVAVLLFERRFSGGRRTPWELPESDVWARSRSAGPVGPGPWESECVTAGDCDEAGLVPRCGRSAISRVSC